MKRQAKTMGHLLFTETHTLNQTNIKKFKSTQHNIKDLIKPPNQINDKTSASKLQQIKNRTKCLRCGQKGHWRLECPLRNKKAIHKVMMQYIEENGNDESAVAKTLLAFAHEEEEYNAFIYHETKSTENNENNSFSALINGVDSENDSVIDSSLGDIVKDLFNQCENSEASSSTYFSHHHHSTTETNLFYVQESLSSLIALEKAKKKNRSNDIQFHGALTDIGAQRSVMGFRQALAYCIFAGIKIKLRKSTHNFLFGVGEATPLGTLSVILPTPGTPIKISIDVIKDDIPFSLGLDTLDKFSPQVLTIENMLQCVREGWKTPVIRKFGHVYYVWDNNFKQCFSKPQLQRLHQHFLHPSATKLFNLLSRATPDKMKPDTFQLLKEISSACETCQVYSPKQISFQVRDREGIKFNQRLLLDIVFLKDKKGKNSPVLHIIDEGTNFQAASFLPKSDVSTVWNTFLKIWATSYVGFPESMLTDQGSVFISKEWSFNCSEENITLKHTGTESHNSLGSGETYHAILRRIFSRTRSEFPNLPVDICLSLAIKAINSTVGPSGLCPQLLVFGIMPKIPQISPQSFPTQIERMKALQFAQKEYERIVSREIIARGLKKIPPPSSNHKFLPGDYVYVYREGLKHYTGPHIVSSVDGKQEKIHLG